MQPLSQEQLHSIALARNIDYEVVRSTNPLEVSTKMSRNFRIPRDVAYAQFCDPATHLRLFSIIKGSSTIPREAIGKLVAPNQLYAIEHVEEQDVTPRMMFVRYTFSPPSTIVKEAVADPFGDLDRPGTIEPMDKKKAIVVIRMEPRGDIATKLTTESTFTATTGKVFARGLIDHIWLNFYENLMVELKELSRADILTKP